MTDVYIRYKGNDRFTVAHPPRGAEYQFMPGCRNIVDGDVWAELSGPGGPLAAYHELFRRTSAPGSGDKSHRVTPKTMAPPTPRRTAEQAIAARRELQDAQAAEIARLREQVAIEAQRRADAEAKVEAIGKGKTEGPGKAQAEPVDGPPIDPSGLSVAKLTAKLEGLSLDDLDAIKDAELKGKNRSGAIEAIDAAINRALESED